MGNMFHDAVAFSGDLGSWNVSAVTDMSKVFKGASLFNSDISGWDVSAATTMYLMFEDATSFQQNLGEWYVVPDDATLLNTVTKCGGIESGEEPKTYF